MKYADEKPRLMLAEEHQSWWDEDTKWFAEEVERLGWHVDDVAEGGCHGIEMAFFDFSVEDWDDAFAWWLLGWASVLHVEKKDTYVVASVPFEEARQVLGEGSWKRTKELRSMR